MPPPVGAPVADAPAAGSARSPAQRAWRRFRADRRGWWSLWIFTTLVVLSLFSEVLSNDRPIVARYEGTTFFPLWNTYPETRFGGDFRTQTDYLDPFIRGQFDKPGNWALYPLNPYRFDTINYFSPSPNPAAPSSVNVLGTDDRGRDVLARLVYGFRVSVLFGLALTAIGVVVGVLTGAVQGYFGGKIDLAFQRFMEIWGSMPELYLLLIFASLFEPGVLILLVILSLFGWMGLSDYVRAEFLRGRNFEYVRAARALGVSDRVIMFRHVLPNAMVATLTFMPFIVTGNVGALAALDFVGYGLPSNLPSLGELTLQAKQNLQAPWLGFTAFFAFAIMLSLMVFIFEGIRDAFDPRKTFR
jgi:microcin C transport system permease protein